MGTKVNPKVTAASIGGGVSGVGLAVLLIWIMQSGVGMAEDQFIPERVAALTGCCTTGLGFLAGWLQKGAV